MSDALLHQLCEDPPAPTVSALGEHIRLDPEQILTGVDVMDPARSGTARIVRLLLHLRDSDGRHSERRLFAKLLDTGDGPYAALGRNEIRFYQEYAADTRLPLPAMASAGFSEDRQTGLLLLEDLGTTHRSASAEDRAHSDVWHAAARALAILHSRFWNLQGVAIRDGQPDEPADVRIRNRREAFRRFRKEAGTLLDPDLLTLYEQAGAEVDRMEADEVLRLGERRNVTLVHGDAHMHNFLFPRTGEHVAILADFQFWHTGIGAGDVAHLTRVDLPDGFDAAAHRALLHTYHTTLLENGVTGYTWADVVADYRMEVASMLFVPVWQCVAFGVPREEWLHEVRTTARTFAVVSELDA